MSPQTIITVLIGKTYAFLLSALSVGLLAYVAYVAADNSSRSLMGNLEDSTLVLVLCSLMILNAIVIFLNSRKLFQVLTTLPVIVLLAAAAVFLLQGGVATLWGIVGILMIITVLMGGFYMFRAWAD